MLIHALVLAAAAASQPARADLPEFILDRDDLVISRSCRLVIPAGTIIRDEGAEGVVQIRGDGHEATPLVVEFAPGSVLRGAQEGADPDRYAGVAVRIVGRSNVTVRGLRVEGYKVGLWATAADDLVLEDCRADDMWRQRLRSTPAAEDQSDWLWPHKNDGNEWVTNYGAALCIEDSAGAVVRRCEVRRGQNGLILDAVDDSQVYDNDFSFLSGWGLAMWRSSGNTISRNALDFCVRGYSHGVYNRGQDSAGILMFEQCSDNIIAENSATHSGDGLFGFGGNLGDKGGGPAPYKGRGCNNNIIAGNDFSCAPAHGLELTFSFGNRIIGNRLSDNAICGIWGGYSQNTLITGNRFEGNGLRNQWEGGGINIEHGAGNVVTGNQFAGNTIGVGLWFDADPGIMETPWAAANHVRPGGCTVYGNTFDGDGAGVRVKDAGVVRVWGNTFRNMREEVRRDGITEVDQMPGDAKPPAPPRYEVLGQTRPVGARAHLRGRDKIVMGPWGPWDHESVLVRRADAGGGRHVYEIFGSGGKADGVCDSPGVRIAHELTGPGRDVVRLTVEPAEASAGSVAPYRLRLRGLGHGEPEREYRGTLIATRWAVNIFPWPADPREDLAAWRQGAAGRNRFSPPMESLSLPFGNGGPKALKKIDPIYLGGAPDWTDRFGTIAVTRLNLPKGCYRFTTLSDDGVRVLVRRAGEETPTAIIENWTWHAPTRDTGEFVQPEAGPVEVTVEHFEIDGYAVLEVQIEAVDE